MKESKPATEAEGESKKRTHEEMEKSADAAKDKEEAPFKEEEATKK